MQKGENKMPFQYNGTTTVGYYTKNCKPFMVEVAAEHRR